MNAAAKRPARRHRRLLIIAIALSLLLTSIVVYGLERGPFICNSGCLVRTPVIDDKTKAFIENEMAPIDRLPLAMWAIGSKYIVCNSTHCTTYTMTFNGRLVGGDRKPIEGNPPPRGGAGGGSGSSGGGTGGANPGSGCYGNCGGGGSGVVTIKPIIPVRPK